jgi:hypothetical protein
MTLIRCVLLNLHRLRVVEYGSIGLVGCQDCGHVDEVWQPMRPEVQHRIDRAHAAVMADRERRASRLGVVPVAVLDPIAREERSEGMRRLRRVK